LVWEVEKKRREDNSIMGLKINKIVLLGMICIGLVVCSGRDIEKNGKSDGNVVLLCFIDLAHCVDDHVCDQKCKSANYLAGGRCKYKTCCCRG